MEIIFLLKKNLSHCLYIRYSPTKNNWKTHGGLFYYLSSSGVLIMFPVLGLKPLEVLGKIKLKCFFKYYLTWILHLHFELFKENQIF